MATTVINKEWDFNPETDGAVSEVGTDEIIFYIDNMHKEVVSSIVDMRNEGRSLKRIKEALQEDERITPDEVDYVIEQIEMWDKLKEDNPGTAKEVVKAVVDNSVAGSITPVKVGPEYTITTSQVPDIAVTELPTVAQVQNTIEGKKQRGPKAGTKSATAGTGKKLSPAEFIALMKEKIALAEVIGNIQLPDVPEGLSKANRELIVKFVKAVEELQAQTLEEIQVQ